MKTKLRPLHVLAAVLGLFLAGHGASAGEGAQQAPERIAALFYADWCGSCEVLDPKIEEARAGLDEDAKTLFVTFDMTDESSKAQSAMLAKALGLGAVYEAHAPTTGYLLVLDAADKSILHRLTKTDDVATIRTQLASR